MNMGCFFFFFCSTHKNNCETCKWYPVFVNFNIGHWSYLDRLLLNELDLFVKFQG